MVISGILGAMSVVAANSWMNDPSGFTLTHGKDRASARSVIGLMTLGAAIGAKLAVKAEGADADQALQAVQALFNDKFGEE